MNSIFILIFQLVILIFSVMIHEVSHGYVADYLGDPTARLAGRLNLNPLNHLDVFGSIILPLTFYVISGGTFVFGWAKPVPYNPYNLRDPKKGGALIAAAGPASNFILALFFGLAIRAILFFDISAAASLAALFSVIVYTNILLGIFNLVPIAPLDGSKVLYAFLPNSQSGRQFMLFMERYGLFLVLIFVFFGFQLIIPIINFVYFIFTGSPSGF
ncbi:MAG: site-2 protease family protein [Patescibacteria group bacterium]|nr:site-2 protease family protein [Patescibacteria group bacterium]